MADIPFKATTMISSRGSTYLLALVVLLAVQTTIAFDTSKLYKYDFEGAVATKVNNDDKPQYSGVALKSTIFVKKTGDDELTVKLEQPQSALFNDVMQEIHKYQYSYKPIERSASLDKSFKIYFDSETRAIKAFDCYKDEPNWVSNFKRGLLSFFQVKIKKQVDSQKSSSYFSTEEQSVLGNCDTDYIVLSDANSINVTKTRDVTKCKSRYLNRFMPVDATVCVESDKDMHLYKHSNAIFNFNLKGSKDNYVIDRVLLDEDSTFTPFGVRNHNHLLKSKFMMVLNKVEESGPISAVEDGAERDEMLAYQPLGDAANFYAQLNLEDAHHLSNIHQTTASVDQTLAAFDLLVEEHRKYSNNALGEGNDLEPNYQENSRLGEYFTKLSQMLATMNYEKIDQLYNKVDERGDAHKKLFWDLMSIVGTNPSFMFIKKLITEGDAPSVKIKEYLPQISYHLKQPNKALFDEYLNLCKSDKISSNQQYKRTCTLPLASLIHQHCVKPHIKFMKLKEQAPKTTCQLNTAEEYFTKIVSSLSSDGGEMSISDKMYQLKLAGELGIKQTIDLAKTYLENQNEHPALRATAMWNLIKLSHLYPKDVKQLVVPYFYDQSELLELRIAAFYNWFQTGISLHEMELLGKQLMLEQNNQLVQYMNKLISSSFNMKAVPCAKSTVETFKMVSPLLRKAAKYHRTNGSLFDSQAYMTSNFLQEFGYGSMSMMSFIYSNNSLGLTNLFHKSNEVMSGISLSPVAISIQAYGAEKLFKRVFGLFSDKNSFMDVFSLKKRAKRFAMEDLSTTPQYNDVYLAATISIYGRPVKFFDIDSKELKKMMSEDGTIKIPQIKKLLHSFNNHSSPRMAIKFEKLELFNNELGLPLYQSIIDFDYNNFKLNSVKMDVEPGFFKDERQGKPPTKITAALDARLVRHNEIFVSSGVLMTNQLSKVGVGFHKRKLVNVPLKISIDANLVDKKLTLKRPQMIDNLLFIKQTPVTFIQNYNPENKLDGRQLPNAWLHLHNSSQMKPWKLDYVTPLTVGVKLEGEQMLDKDYSIPAWRKYLNETDLSAIKFNYFYSPTGTAYQVRLSGMTVPDGYEKSSATDASKKCTSSGFEFGPLDPNGSKELVFELPAVGGDQQECQARSSGSSEQKPTSSFCAAGKMVQDVCRGEKGTPMSCFVDGYYEVNEIMSWVYKCGRKDLPGLITRATTFINWFNQLTSVND